ncbi:hypothetical protein Tco_1067217 [Tanacetum coccineum]|uniref:Uncharacterized protein n=1 Tax=Tanacetum coccineum TaxID=301880 RepID=A0ABQ5HE11_9ASTR
MIPQDVLMRSGIKADNAPKPKAVHNGVVKGNRFNVIKASACWVWMPKNRVIDHGRLEYEQEEITTVGAEISSVSPEVKIASDSIYDIVAET